MCTLLIDLNSLLIAQGLVHATTPWNASTNCFQLPLGNNMAQRVSTHVGHLCVLLNLGNTPGCLLQCIEWSHHLLTKLQTSKVHNGHTQGWYNTHYTGKSPYEAANHTQTADKTMIHCTNETQHNNRIQETRNSIEWSHCLVANLHEIRQNLALTHAWLMVSWVGSGPTVRQGPS